MLDDKDIELLEAYTYGNITPEAEAHLRARLQKDPSFAAAVRRWELIEREGFMAEPSQATRDAVAAALDNTSSSATATRSRPWWQYLLGGLVVLLLTYAAWSLLGPSSTAPATAPPTETVEENIYADLVDEYFRHLPSENFHLGSEGTLEERALAAYEARDYATALPLLLETVEMGGDSLNLLYAGVAALGSGDGVGYFQKLNARSFSDDVSYYSALAFLKDGRLYDAISQLNRIPDSSKYYALKIQLITELNENN